MSEFKPEWVHQYAPRAKVMFDIGAFDGTDTLRFARALPGLRLVAFECNPGRGELTQRILAEAGIPCEVLAITDRDGPVTFHPNLDQAMGGVGVSGSTLPPTERLLKENPHLTFTQPVTVLGQRLDSFCLRQGIVPDVLHLDVQGAEWNVLQGMGALRPRLIFLEIGEVTQAHYEGSKDAQVYLADLGYRQVWTSPHDALYIL